MSHERKSRSIAVLQPAEVSMERLDELLTDAGISHELGDGSYIELKRPDFDCWITQAETVDDLKALVFIGAVNFGEADPAIYKAINVWSKEHLMQLYYDDGLLYARFVEGYHNGIRCQSFIGMVQGFCAFVQRMKDDLAQYRTRNSNFLN